MGPFARLAIYKRFASLNSYNLLLRQAELLHLEQRLRVCISVDTATGLNFHESVQDMLDAADAGAVRVEQWELVLEVRTKLEAYSTSHALHWTPNAHG